MKRFAAILLIFAMLLLSGAVFAEGETVFEIRVPESLVAEQTVAKFNASRADGIIRVTMGDDGYITCAVTPELSEELMDMLFPGLVQEKPEQETEEVTEQEVENPTSIYSEDFGAMEIEHVIFTNRACPGNTTAKYTYWGAKEDMVYVDMAYSFKNLGSEKIDVFTTLRNKKLVYNGKYEYTGLSTVESHDRTDISGFSRDILPLCTEYCHWLIEVPMSVYEGTESVELFFTFNGVEYSYILR